MKMLLFRLPNLGRYANEIEKINIEQSISNKLKLITELEALFNFNFLSNFKNDLDEGVIEEKKYIALKHLTSVKNKWVRLFGWVSNDFKRLSRII